ncbi:MAG: sarcosine oxidase subunit gamma [Gemmatimonadetes bacterium]|nr:sarcosine oxidase subunit gamma [Gemmatimonadota bacterium]
MAERSWQTLMRNASHDAARLELLELRPGLTLRARGTGCERLARALELAALPAVNVVSRGASGVMVCGLRPDEWALLGGAPNVDALRAAVGDEGAVIDTTASRVGLVLEGPRVREVLASCCALDVRPRVLPPGRCAQTLIGRAGVFIAPLAPDRYLVACRPSSADYVVRWLTDGMALVR